MWYIGGITHLLTFYKLPGTSKWVGWEGVYLPWPGLRMLEVPSTIHLNQYGTSYISSGWMKVVYIYYTRKLFGLPMFGFHIYSAENKLVYFLFLSFFTGATVTGTIPSKSFNKSKGGARSTFHRQAKWCKFIAKSEQVFGPTGNCALLSILPGHVGGPFSAECPGGNTLLNRHVRGNNRCRFLHHGYRWY